MNGLNKDLVGERIKECRKIAKLSQQELADRLGMERTNISNYESGRVLPSLPILYKLSKMLSTSSDYLLGLTYNKSRGQEDTATETLLKEVADLKETINKVKKVVGVL